MSNKRLAIHLYGMIRTYKRTYESFLKNVIKANELDGWEIDIFMHIWDVFNLVDNSTWHKKNNYFPTMNNKKLTNEDIEDIKAIYSPARFQIDSDTREYGRYESIKRAMKLREEYESEYNIKYDWFLTTRTDIFFMNPLKISHYIDFYSQHVEFKYFGIADKMNFCVSYPFRGGGIQVMDHRHPNESDILWFSNYCSNQGMDPLISYKDKNIVNVFIKYQLNVDCFQVREITKQLQPNITVSKMTIDQYEDKVTLLQNQIKDKENQIKKIQSGLKDISHRKQELEILDLEYGISLKKKHIEAIENNILLKKIQISENKKNINYNSNIIYKENSAKFRIQNQLSYKLGQAMIVNSKSILGYIRMPFVLSYIHDKHKQEQKIYQEKIKKDPSLKLPPLESYPDYKEALK
ncbi:hypothetical protein ACM15O_001785, partial [Campylobacter coli]